MSTAKDAAYEIVSGLVRSFQQSIESRRFDSTISGKVLAIQALADATVVGADVMAAIAAVHAEYNEVFAELGEYSTALVTLKNEIRLATAPPSPPPSEPPPPPSE